MSNYTSNEQKRKEPYLRVPILRQTDLNCNERYTLAWILYRGRLKEKGAVCRIPWLVSKTNFTRATVYKHLKTLIQKKYVIELDRNRYAPTDNEHYKHKGKKANWIDDITYFVIDKFDYSNPRPKVYVFVYNLFYKNQLGSNQKLYRLARMLGLSKRQLRRVLQRMQADGLIRRMVCTKNGRNSGIRIAALS
jgi:DNA-binding MarR family transcriptional regulator